MESPTESQPQNPEFRNNPKPLTNVFLLIHVSSILKVNECLYGSSND